MTQEDTYKYLDKLNWFSDATSYSLTQMTDAFSKFTANGAAADEAVQAIYGVATASSKAGISASDPRFNSILYNMSQALGTGKMQLTDWRSLELANVTTMDLRKNMLQAGVAAGTLTDNMDGTYSTAKGTLVTAENIRDTLSDDWMTKDVMLSGFGKYGSFVNTAYDYAKKTGSTAEETMEALKDTDDQFGYSAMRAAQETKTWEEAVDATKDAISTDWYKIFTDVIGNYEEAKEVWTEVADVLYNMFAAPLDGLEKLLSKWKQFGGRTALLKALKNILESIKSVVDSLTTSFRKFFPALDAHKLTEITMKFASFTEKMKPSSETLDKLGRSFDGVFSVLKLGKKILGVIFGLIGKLFEGISGGLTTLGKHKMGILDITAAIGDWLTKTTSWIENNAVILKILSAIGNALSFVGNIIGNVIKAIGGLFAGMETAGTFVYNMLVAITNPIMNILENIGINISPARDAIFKVFSDIGSAIDWIIDKISKIDFKGILASIGTHLSNIWDIIKGIASTLIGKDFGGIVKGISDKVGDIITKIKGFDFEGFFSNIHDKLSGIKDKLEDLFEKIKNLFPSNKSSDSTEKFAEGVDSVSDSSNNAGKNVGSFGEKLKSLASSVSKVLSGLGFNNIAIGIDTISNALVGFATVGVFKSLKGTLNSLKDLIDIFSGKKKISEKALDPVADSVERLGKAVSHSVNATALLKVAAAVAVLVGSMKLMSSIDPKMLGKTFGFVDAFLVELATALGIISKIDNGSAGTSIIGQLFNDKGAFSPLLTFSKSKSNLTAAGTALLEVSVGVLALSKACEKLGNMKPDNLYRGGAAIIVFMGAMVGFAYAVSTKKINTDNITKVSKAMNMVATAVSILSVAIAALSLIPYEKLKAGLIGVTTAFILLLGAVVVLGESKNTKGMIEAAGAMMMVAAAIQMVSVPVMLMSLMPLDKLATGLIGLGTEVAAMTGSLAVLSESKNTTGMIAAAGAMMMMAMAVQTISVPIMLMSLMPFEKLAVGMSVVGAALLVMTGILKILGDADNVSGMLAAAGAMMMMAMAIQIISIPIMAMSLMDFNTLSVGLAGVGAALLGMTASLAALSLFDPVNLLAAAAAMLVVSISINVFVIGLTAFIGVLLMLGSIDMDTIGAGVGHMAAVMGALVIAGLAALIAAPGFLAMGAAMVVLGAGIALTGVGIASVGAGLTALTAGIVAIGALGSVAIAKFIAAMSILLPAIGTIAGKALANLIISLAVNLEKIFDVLTPLTEKFFAWLQVVLTGLLELINTAVAELLVIVGTFIDGCIDLVIGAITTLLDDIDANIDDWVTKGADIIIAFLNGMGEQIPNVVDAGFKMVIDTINGIAQAIDDNTEALCDAVEHLINSLINAALTIMDHIIPGFKDAAQKIFGSDGFIGGILSKVGEILSTIGDAIKKALDKVTEKLGQWKDKGKELLGKLISGIGEKISELKSKVKDAIDKAKQAISDKVWEWKNAGKDLIQGIINGVREKFDDVREAAVGAVSNAVGAVKNFLGIGSPSKLFRQYGIWTDEGFINGINHMADKVSEATGGMASNAVNAFKDNVIDFSSYLNDDTNPVITPVLDLTDVENGINLMDSQFAGGRTIDISGSYNAARYADSAMAYKASSANRNGNTTNNNVPISVTINPTSNQDPNEIADAVVDRITNEMRRKDVVFA